MMFIVLGIAPAWFNEEEVFDYRAKSGHSHNSLPHTTVFIDRAVAQKNADSWNENNHNEWTYVVKELV